MRDTVDKAPAWSRVVISDASHLDDTADRLKEIYGANPRVSVISRPQRVGWVEHANLLLEESSTELFCWMPQDDLVSPDRYFEMLVRALDQNPDRVLAFPDVYRRVSTGRLRRREIEPMVYRPLPIGLGKRSPPEEAVTMLRSGTMAHHCWRGVFRAGLARPIPERGYTPDLTWTFSMALAGHFIRIPEARYLKRLHSGSAHRAMRWPGMAESRQAYVEEISARLGGQPERRDAVIGELDRFLARLRFLHQKTVIGQVGRFVLNAPRPVLE